MKTASWWLSLVASGRIVLLCFCGASGGSTLFTLGNPYIMEIPRCLIICVDMGVPFLVALCASTLWYKNFISGLYALVRINPHEVVWLLSFFQSLGEEIWVVSLETLFCGLQYSAGLLELFHGRAISFGNTVWVVFLDEYPWRTRVALNPKVELLHCMCIRLLIHQSLDLGCCPMICQRWDEV